MCQEGPRSQSQATGVGIPRRPPRQHARHRAGLRLCAPLASVRAHAEVGSSWSKNRLVGWMALLGPFLDPPCSHETLQALALKDRLNCISFRLWVRPSDQRWPTGGGK